MCGAASVNPANPTYDGARRWPYTFDPRRTVCRRRRPHRYKPPCGLPWRSTGGGAPSRPRARPVFATRVAVEAVGAEDRLHMFDYDLDVTLMAHHQSPAFGARRGRVALNSQRRDRPLLHVVTPNARASGGRQGSALLPMRNAASDSRLPWRPRIPIATLRSDKSQGEASKANGKRALQNIADT